jgi:hypothetical protein
MLCTIQKFMPIRETYKHKKRNLFEGPLNYISYSVFMKLNRWQEQSEQQELTQQQRGPEESCEHYARA